MKYRTATLLAATGYAADKSEIIDIDLMDPISQLFIGYQAMGTGAGSGTAHPVRCIPKIEMMAGGDTFFSLSGAEAQALSYYHRKKEPFTWLRWLNDNTCEAYMTVDFGRWLWDEKLAFDPSQFKNPQLKITIDLDGGGVAPDAGTMFVLAHIFDEKKIAPEGFLTAREIVSYTLANNAHEYTDLPVDMAIRKLLIRAQRYDYQPDQQMARIKLTEDQDKHVIFDEVGEYLCELFAMQNPPYQEGHIGAGIAASRSFYCTPTYSVKMASSEWRAALGCGDIALWGGSGGKFYEIQANAGPNWQALVQGYLPHGCLEIPFGDQSSPEDWFDKGNTGSLKADITGGADVGVGQTCELVVQQLRRY